MPMAGLQWARRRAPEAALALVAVAVFLGFLGSVDLWGKREQRASAEAIDTIDHGRWLVAEIQGRPRLEKPPLPRWTTAALMRLTGRRDEGIVRLPGALAALGMVGLVYGLGRRWGAAPWACPRGWP
jgi:4-amino-4-deoxy-L-arabinose transferase-like glycosyltransferase